MVPGLLTEDHVPGALVSKDLGIAEVGELFGVAHDRAALLEGGAVDRGGKALHLVMGAWILVNMAQVAISGIEDVEEAVVARDGRARPAAVVVGLDRGGKRHRLVPPGEKVI